MKPFSPHIRAPDALRPTQREAPEPFSELPAVFEYFPEAQRGFLARPE